MTFTERGRVSEQENSDYPKVVDSDETTLKHGLTLMTLEPAVTTVPLITTEGSSCTTSTNTLRRTMAITQYRRTRAHG